MAGRRMPHNNRVSSSTALRTNDIWSKTIGHNPYKNEDDDANDEAQTDQAAGLMLLAKMTNVSGSETRGGCSKCGMMGHLRFQCRNTIQLASTQANDDSSSSSSSDEEEEVQEERTPSENWGTKLDASKSTENSSRRDTDRGRSPERRRDDDRSRSNGRTSRKREDDRSRSRSRDRADQKKKSKKEDKKRSEHKETKRKEKKKKSSSGKKDHKSRKSRDD